MTPEQTRKAAEVMLAHAEGKRIECIFRKSSCKWEVAPNPIWEWGSCDYRVAPEPWSGKIWVHPDGQAHQETFFSYSANEAIRDGWRLIDAKEVTE